MARIDDIIFLENLASRSWSGFEELPYDGWVMRFGGGYSNRANSISTHSSTLPIEEKVFFCEQAYANQNLPTIFKLTEATHPLNLESYLISRGYSRTHDTSVMRLPLTGLFAQNIADVVTLQPTLTHDWLEAFQRMKHLDERKNEAHRLILERITTPVVYASITQENRIIAGGVGVIDAGYLGIFDVVVDEAFRQQGLGKAITTALLQWGSGERADMAYLQVDTLNTPALRIYRSVGFQELYRYWYRIQA